ncbi:hypothetical protein E2C01_034333 [Portunus trituberculatus]|uniref:Uncharacterized protein n=1 Tax=Portunus trituberculatus TaxID=210409 RepID=A0A5B7F5Y2_PORTR|nr:hypothetical protein [Portunus trituberculatus]
MAVSTQQTVPSPPATTTRHVTSGGRRWHHSRASSGGQRLRSITCAGFNTLQKEDSTASASLLPDLVFPAMEWSGICCRNLAVAGIDW